MQIRMEVLEDRTVPAVSVIQNGTALLVNMTSAGFASVQATAVVTSDGTVPLTGPVTSVVVNGSEGRDIVEVNIPANAVILGNGGNDALFGGTGSNLIDGGTGVDEIYALLGTNVVNAQDYSGTIMGPNPSDAVFTNAAAFVTSDPADAVARFFAPGRTPGAGSIGMGTGPDDAGTLYINPGNSGSTTTLTQSGTTTTVTYDFGGGPQVASFKGVRLVAYFGGSGADTYLNNTTLSEAAYGSAGPDRLVGGKGNLSVLKGSGDFDNITGRAAVNDISTNPSAGSQDVVSLVAGKDNVVRAGANDLVLSVVPYTLVPQLI